MGVMPDNGIIVGDYLVASTTPTSDWIKETKYQNVFALSTKSCIVLAHTNTTTHYII